MTNAEKFNTAGERAKAFHKWCEEKQKTAIGKVAKHECSDCPLDEHTPCCFFYWLDLEAEEEKIEDCPYCGGKCEIGEHSGFVYCVEGACRYSYGRKGASVEENIDAHNRVARAVGSGQKEEEK